MSDDVRPFFGERSEPVGAPPPVLGRPTAAFTFTERYDRHVQQGVCPSAGCHQPLTDGRCPACGWDKTLHDTPAPAPVDDDYVETLPGALFLEEEP